MVDQDKLRQKVHYIREELKNLRELEKLSHEQFLVTICDLNYQAKFLTRE